MSIVSHTCRCRVCGKEMKEDTIPEWMLKALKDDWEYRTKKSNEKAELWKQQINEPG